MKNLKKGQLIHREHFEAIRKNGQTANGWEVVAVDQSLSVALDIKPRYSRKRPDWVLINRLQKRALIIDITAQYRPRHYRKGQVYVSELKKILNDPTWDVAYIEDYWFNATIH